MADRFVWVQYPDIRSDMQRRAALRHPLRWEQRVGLGLIGLLGLLLSTVVLAIALFVIWAIFTG